MDARWLVLCGLTAALGGSSSFCAEPPAKVDFNRDVRPILSDVCFKCHGPDEKQRVSDLRLDQKAAAFADLGGFRAIVPKDLQRSELYRRITSSDDDQRMPPSDSGRQLSKRQIDVLGRWIEQGATWDQHWSFVAPRRVAPPRTRNTTWSRNAIDQFILARLERAGIRPAPEADRRTLIRRVTLDLTGLPPTPAEVDAYLRDTMPGAYGRVVDRLLRSERFGERMAMNWLDAARYADTSGYQNDGPRDMWRWRDWVIEAFNSNMPYDQFTIEQLAGDLLPHPTLEQRLATAFNRNHRGNAEGGIIPAEYQVEYVVDRVDTTFTVWLGLTMGCARCHDHKYDPITQREYYQVFACFNNIPESGRAIKEGNSPPYMKAPTPAQRQQLADLDRQIQAASDAVRRTHEPLIEEQRAWEQREVLGDSVDWMVRDKLLARFPLDGRTDNVVAGTNTSQVSPPPDQRFTSGRIGKGLALTGQGVEVGDLADFGYFDAFSLTAWIRPTKETGTILSRMNPVERGDGYYVHLENGHLQVNLVKRWLDDSIRIESRRPLKLNRWQHVTVTYDGSRVAPGVSVYIDGRAVETVVHLDGINQSFAVADQPLRIGAGQSGFHGEIDEVRVYQRALSPAAARMTAVAESVSDIRRLEPKQRTAAQAEKLADYFLAKHASAPIRGAHARLRMLLEQRKALDESLPTVMVMQELATPRVTRLLERGQYDRPGVVVEPGVPGVLPPLPADGPLNRLGLARWLVAQDHPLTSRVAVNRFWQQLFPNGLVRTPEDFGAQGDRPSHPELLDWLATEFVRTQWNVKHLLKLMVTSATYRQSSRGSTVLLELDPGNRLLARGPRTRLPAEMIRDQALFVSGLLKEQIGGPSVRPYQPAGLWKDIASTTDYQQSHGDSLYRRSLYTYWKRTVAPPSMVTLDAPTRETCQVRRPRTNTPLQALALMNDVTFVEAARVLAQRVMTSASNDEDRLRACFVLATSRPPSAKELAILKRSLRRGREVFEKQPAAAQSLVTTGEYRHDPTLDAAELAALTTVASLILNLDEVVNKP